MKKRWKWLYDTIQECKARVYNYSQRETPANLRNNTQGIPTDSDKNSVIVELRETAEELTSYILFENKTISTATCPDPNE
jgi:hypothetical protein